jgi:hypothetical protein
MLVRDAAGNEVIVNDEILLDTTPPEAELTVAEGNQFIRELLVSVRLVATDATSGVAKMRASNSDDFSDVSWKEYDEEFDWLFPEGEGMKTLFVQVKDGVGLTISLDVTVILDTTSPTGFFTINHGETHVKVPLVTLNLDFYDDFGLDAVRISNTPILYESWIEYASSIEWDLGHEGMRSVNMEVSDNAGNIASAQAVIVYDKTHPIIEFIAPNDKETTNEKVTVEVSVADNIDSNPEVSWRINGGPWNPLVGSTFNVKLTEGQNLIEVQATDGAGNEAIEPLKIRKDPKLSIAYNPLLWLIVIVVIVAVGLWQWTRRKGGMKEEDVMSNDGISEGSSVNWVEEESGKQQD